MSNWTLQQDDINEEHCSTSNVYFIFIYFLFTNLLIHSWLKKYYIFNAILINQLLPVGVNAPSVPHCTTHVETGLAPSHQAKKGQATRNPPLSAVDAPQFLLLLLLLLLSPMVVVLLDFFASGQQHFCQSRFLSFSPLRNVHLDCLLLQKTAAISLIFFPPFSSCCDFAAATTSCLFHLHRARTITQSSLNSDQRLLSSRENTYSTARSLTF